jgi:hypothetical protein
LIPEISSIELTAVPPQAKTSLSMFLLLALLRAMIPSRAKASKQIGSIPFWFRTTKVLLVPSQTYHLIYKPIGNFIQYCLIIFRNIGYFRKIRNKLKELD